MAPGASTLKRDSRRARRDVAGAHPTGAAGRYVTTAITISTATTITSSAPIATQNAFDRIR
jgi:hypothetical protein